MSLRHLAIELQSALVNQARYAGCAITRDRFGRQDRSPLTAEVQERTRGLFSMDVRNATSGIKLTLSASLLISAFPTFILPIGTELNLGLITQELFTRGL